MLRLSITNAPRRGILPLRIDYDIMLVAYKEDTQYAIRNPELDALKSGLSHLNCEEERKYPKL